MQSAGRNRKDLAGLGSFDGYKNKKNKKNPHFSFKLKYTSLYDYTSNQKNLYTFFNPLRIKDRPMKLFP